MKSRLREGKPIQIDPPTIPKKTTTEEEPWSASQKSQSKEVYHLDK
ncbi:MAG: hypothetical protein IPL46_26500 [Saprospiraceae bacterium]|nr:hypothetical protein [Saprospiraceae bacterium]